MVPGAAVARHHFPKHHQTHATMPSVPTVKIEAKSDLGYEIINAADFDEKKHKRFDEAKSSKTPAKSK